MVMKRQGDNVRESIGWITVYYVNTRSPFNVQNSIKSTISSYFMKLGEHVLRMLRKKIWSFRGQNVQPPLVLYSLSDLLHTRNGKFCSVMILLSTK